MPFLLEAVESGLFTIKRQNCFKILYHYTKIRGYQITSTPNEIVGPDILVQFLPNDVYLLEPLVTALSGSNLQWQTTYILLLWLSLICLAPFDLQTIGSVNNDQTLATKLLDLAKRHLKSAGKQREASAILCARVVSRSDVWRTELPSFLTWAIQIFSAAEDNLLLV